MKTLLQSFSGAWSTMLRPGTLPMNALTRFSLLALLALSGCGEAVVGDSPEPGAVVGAWSLTSITVPENPDGSGATMTITNQNGSAMVDGLPVRVEGTWTFADDGTFEREMVYYIGGIPGSHPDWEGAGEWALVETTITLDEPAGTLTEETHMIMDAEVSEDTLALVQTEAALAADPSLLRAMTFAR